MSQRRRHSSSKSVQDAPAGDAFRSPARQTRSSSQVLRLADFFDPPVTRSSSKNLQSSTLLRSSRLLRRNSAPVSTAVPVKGAVPAASTQDALLVPADATAPRKSERLLSRHASAPPQFRPSLDPVPEVFPESPSGPSQAEAWRL